MIRKKSNRSRRNRCLGFTMPEIMVAVVLFSASTAMVMGGFSKTISASVASVSSGVMHRELRLALSRVAKDVMEANSVHSHSENYFLILRKSSPSGDFYVYYILSNGMLYRFTSNAPGSQILGRNIRRFDLEYFNLNNQLTTSFTQTAIVHIRLSGQTTRRGNVFNDTVETRVRLRNKQV